MARRRPLTSPALLCPPQGWLFASLGFEPRAGRRGRSFRLGWKPQAGEYPPEGRRPHPAFGTEQVGGVRASLHRFGRREHRVRQLLEDRDVRELQLAVAFADLDAMRSEHDVAVFLPPFPAPGGRRALL